MNISRRSRWATPTLAVIVGLSAPIGAATEERTTEEHAQVLATATRLVESSGSPGGVCAVAGRNDADLAMAIAGRGRFVVHCLYGNPELRDRMRETIRSRDLYGIVSAATFDGRSLPYTDNLVNLLVVDAYPALVRKELRIAEILRVLAPLGTAFVGASAMSIPSVASPPWVTELTTQLQAAGIEDLSVVEEGGTWVRLRKPWPRDIDEWTHYLHGPDGNPVAEDRVVGPPRRYQWISRPMWQRSHETDSSISSLVTSRGRLFYIVDEAPISLAGDHSLPDKWFLVAQDAFNGVQLWKVPIRRWGWREWKHSWFTTRPGDMPLNRQKRLVADGERVYVTLGYQAPVSELDARTGEILQTYAGTERTGEILYLDGTLVLSVLEDDGIRVVAVRAESGEERWRTEKAYRGSTVDYIRWRTSYGSVKPPELDPSLNTATDGKVVAFLDGPDVVGVDFATGGEKWRSRFPSDQADLNAGGMRSEGNLWIGTMIVRDGVVIHASPNKLAAFSAAAGERLWTQPKKYIGHLWYEWKDVFVIGGLVWTWSAELDKAAIDLGGGRTQRPLSPRTVIGYDLESGEVRKQVSLGTIFKTHHHHRCYRNKATERYILASRRGTEYVDLEGGRHTVHNWVRGTCHVGMMPANGLQYAPPHPCACYMDEKLSGLNALAPAPSEKPVPDSTAEARRGPAFGKVEAVEAKDGDWPAFRHDSLRTGSVATRVPDDAELLWRQKVGRNVSPPVVAAGQLYASLVDEHHVVCLDAGDGRRVWEFAAGARIDSPPTYHRGTVLVGSADGWVYCLGAADGELVWRFRAAPAERLIGAFGQLESAWPVPGSVLVENGTAYFAAGRSSHLDGGIRVFGVDASTGELRCETKLVGPSYAAGDFDVNYGLPMGALPDIALSDGRTIYMRAEAFDLELKPKKGSPSLETGGGLLEDSYFKRTPWTFGDEYARLIVHDRRSVYYVRMFDTLRGLDPSVFFTPGAKGYLLFAKNVGSEKKKASWSERVPVRIRAMVLASGRLFVAGPPDEVDPRDPLGAFEGRKGGRLYAIDATTGKRLAEHTLPSPPVFNGAAAARGRLFITQEDGSIACFGER